jgi:acetyl-CoA carboxylase biotin carboxyl carrier protein
MDFNLVKKIVRLVEESKINELEIEENEMRIRVTKGAPAPDVLPSFTGIHIPAQTDIPAPAAPAQAEATKKAEPKADNLHEVKSPIVGSFYASPSPDAESYVKVGDSVSQGQVLCIVEAMKLMNEIESDVSGKIVKILAQNGQPVEYNQPLFVIEI